MSWKPIDTAPRDGTEIVVVYRRPRNGALIAAVSLFDDEEWVWAEESDQDEMLTAGDVPFAWVEKPD